MPVRYVAPTPPDPSSPPVRHPVQSPVPEESSERVAMIPVSETELSALAEFQQAHPAYSIHWQAGPSRAYRATGRQEVWLWVWPSSDGPRDTTRSAPDYRAPTLTAVLSRLDYDFRHYGFSSVNPHPRP